MTLDLRELAWAAGLFEGEGNFCLNRRPGYTYPRAQLSSTDLDTLQRFRSAVGVGNIVGPYDRVGCKPIWSWRSANYGDIQHVVCLLWFGLGERRKVQATSVLEATR